MGGNFNKLDAPKAKHPFQMLSPSRIPNKAWEKKSCSHKKQTPLSAAKHRSDSGRSGAYNGKTQMGRHPVFSQGGNWQEAERSVLELRWRNNKARLHPPACSGKGRATQVLDGEELYH